MLFNGTQEEISRRWGVKQPSPPPWLRHRSSHFRRQLANDINRKCRPQTYAHARHARPRPLDPHPSQVLFVSSSPSSSQRLGPAPSLSDLTALIVCMHTSLLYKPRPLSLAATFPDLHLSGSLCQGRCFLHLGPACAHCFNASPDLSLKTHSRCVE